MTNEDNADGSQRDTYSSIGEEVGARLMEHRVRQNLTLRHVAEQAEVSASHLSDIERGRTQASLPVLLRLVRALELTITELLPRIGGHHVRSGSFDAIDVGSSDTASHSDLELQIELVRLQAGDHHHIDNPQLGDLLVFVLDGSIDATIGEIVTNLRQGDTLDTERLPSCSLTAGERTDLLIAAQKAGPT